MNDAGYTLSEMLAALVMIGLAVGGLTQGVQVIGLIQSAGAHALAESRALRRSQAIIDSLLEGRGPFATDTGRRLVGTARGFQFDCDRATPCTAEVGPLGQGVQLVVEENDRIATVLLPTGIDTARFSYGGAWGRADTWPPTEVVGRVTLSWVALTGRRGSVELGADVPLVLSRLWTEQPRHCVFDAIALACRRTAG